MPIKLSFKDIIFVMEDVDAASPIVHSRAGDKPDSSIRHVLLEKSASTSGRDAEECPPQDASSPAGGPATSDGGVATTSESVASATGSGEEVGDTIAGGETAEVPPAKDGDVKTTSDVEGGPDNAVKGEGADCSTGGEVAEASVETSEKKDEEAAVVPLLASALKGETTGGKSQKVCRRSRGSMRCLMPGGSVFV